MCALLDAEESANMASRVPLVVIAASAGGLDPISEILDFYPSGLPVATVVIQHLSPSYRSELVNLLQSHTSQPVSELRNGTELRPGEIYVIQPGTQIVLVGDMVKAVTRDEFERPYFTIDVFLESVARRANPINTCVVLLSGTGSDGTLGCRAVHNSGGYVLVQQLSDAKFDGMPLSVINSGAYDEVQPPRKIPARITAWLENNMQRPKPPGDLLDSDPLALLYANGDSAISADGGGDINPYAGIFDLMRATFDLDLHAYKIGTLDRRITQRMRRLGFSTIQEYHKFLAQGGSELRALFSDLMIGVTSFFRNPQVFELLESKILPDLIERSDEPLKIWVCGCSTGEEAYSVAMLLQKLVLRMDHNPEFRIYATDINPDAIRRASEATFEYGNLQPFISRFGLQEFVSSNEDFGRLRVNTDIRRKIIFSVQNVLKHSPLHALDLVMCRNMLIYFRSEAQRKVISNFHFGLKDEGVLVLGESEGPSGLDPYFSEVDARLKVFAKRPGVQLSASDRWQLNRSVAPLTIRNSSTSLRESASSPVARGAFESAFVAISGNSLIVRSDGDIQYMTGNAGEIFARSIPGRPTLNVHTHLQDIELQALLQLGIGHAIESEQPIQWAYPFTSTESPLKFDTLRFVRLSSAIEREPSILVQMIDANVDVFQSRETESSKSGLALLASLQANEGGLSRLATLERQNAQLRQLVSESLQDKETFHEELQSANEELLSSNEELQSTNEELQSVNEELHSVNAELEEKIRQLTEANNDITNLLASTDVALLFLDEHLRIRRFTDIARTYFPLGLQDIGRPIEDLNSDLGDLDIASIGRSTIQKGEIERHEARCSNGRWLQAVFFPYFDQVQRISGVVLTIYDITQTRHQLQLEEEARLRRELIQGVLNISYLQAPDLSTGKLTVDPALCQQLGLPETAIDSRDALLEYVHPDDAEKMLGAFENIDSSNDSIALEFRIRDTNDHYHWLLFTGARSPSLDGNSSMVALLLDIDSRKRNDLQMREQEITTIHANRIFNIGMLASGVAHELNNPLSALQLGNEQLSAQLEKPEPNLSLISRIASTQADAVIRMDRIISSLLRFARKDETTTWKPVHVETLLQDVQRLTNPMALEANVELTIAPVPCQLTVHGHPLELAQTLINLVNNSIQQIATRDARWIRIETALDDGMVVFRVIDSGLTSDIKQPDSLFIPFYTTKDVGRGTGLGLPLSQGIVEAHGGMLLLDRESINTTFVLKIPSHNRE